MTSVELVEILPAQVFHEIGQAIGRNTSEHE